MPEVTQEVSLIDILIGKSPSGSLGFFIPVIQLEPSGFVPIILILPPIFKT